MRLFTKVCFCLLILAGVAVAQTDRGTITGTIKDPAGAVAPNAGIQMKNPATGADYSTASTSTGNYTLAQLPAGTYDLTVTMSGFKTYLRQGITVGAAQTLRVDVVLEVGAISETVTVSEDAPLLKTESGELSHNVRSDTLDSLPVLSIGAGAGSTGIRNPYAVMQLIPGADWRPDQSVRVNGVPGNTQALRVEGMDATNNMWQQQGQYVQQGVDAIQEFAVQTSNYAAEFGQAGSAVFNLTMKSGTNQLHGSAYDYFVNEALNASTPYSEDAAGNKNRPRSRRNDFGFTLGGPVFLPKLYDGRDKSFFFFSFEEYRQATTAKTAATVPTLKMRDGDFSEILGNVIYTDHFGRQIRENQLFDWTHPHTALDPITNQMTTYWDPFQNNVIPKSLLDPSSLLIQDKFPKPENNQLTQNWSTQTANSTVTFIPSVKIDYALSARAKLSGYWSRNSFNTTADDGLPVDITAGVPNTFVSHTARLNFDYTVAPTMLLHIGTGLMYNQMRQLAPTGVDTRKTFGINTQAKGFPYITGLSSGYGGFSPTMGTVMNSQLQNIKPTANPSFTWIKGNHSYKFGGELIIESHPSYSETFANNWFTFLPGQTGDPSLAYTNLGGKTIGNVYASFLTGRVASGNTNAPSRGHLGAHSFAFYAQDSWKITPKLTLDYGLRYDYQTYLKEQYGRWANFSPATPNPKIINPVTNQPLPGAVIFEGSGPGRCNCDFAKVYPFAFGPRLGLAYQILPKTVLRAGAGLSYGRTPELGYLNNTLSSFVTYGATAPGQAATLLHNGPPPEASVVWPDIRPDAFPRLPSLGPPPVAIDANAGRPPRIFQWSIGLQREITKDLVAEASYVGNRGAWWQANGLMDINAVTPEYLLSKGFDISKKADRDLLTSQYQALPASVKDKYPIPFIGFPTTSTLIQTLRPFPQFTTINYLWAPLGRTWYDSLQVKVTKRYSHNFDLSYSFTYQKEMTMGSEVSYQSFGTLNPQATNDVFNRGVNKYISGLSRPFTNIIALSYTVPRLFNGNRIVSELMRDWQINAMLRDSSGAPIRVAAASGNLNTVLARATNTLVNRVPGQPLFTDQNGKAIDINSNFEPDTTFVLNPKAWAQPADGTFGYSTAYYNDYRGRRHPTENMSLARNFRLGHEGRMTLQLRAEFNNIFNRLYVPDPSATSPGATQSYQTDGVHTKSGFGYINMKDPSVASNVRSGQIVARLTF